MTACAVLGLDTSNYTTSAAVFDGADGYQLGRLLDVCSRASLGLRQSDALFQHVKRLPELFDRLRAEGRLDCGICRRGGQHPAPGGGGLLHALLSGGGVPGAGRWPTPWGCPFFPAPTSRGTWPRRPGRPGGWSCWTGPFLAWHLSGGTTELLYVEPDGAGCPAPGSIGGTSDISAGQLIDRTGVLLGLHFPAGKALDAL